MASISATRRYAFGGTGYGSGNSRLDALASCSDHDPLDLIESDLIAASVVELGGARRGVCGHLAGMLKLAVILEVGGDPGRTEGVVGDPPFSNPPW